MALAAEAQLRPYEILDSVRIKAAGGTRQEESR